MFFFRVAAMPSSTTTFQIIKNATTHYFQLATCHGNGTMLQCLIFGTTSDELFVTNYCSIVRIQREKVVNYLLPY